MNTEQKNKIIAEFIGFESITEKYFEDNGFENENQMITDTKECKYFTSWDWLMPVIDKIESSSVEGHYFTIHISTEKTEIKNDMFLVVFENEGLSKIENTYNAVVQFIEYYNQEKN